MTHFTCLISDLERSNSSPLRFSAMVDLRAERLWRIVGEARYMVADYVQKAPVHKLRHCLCLQMSRLQMVSGWVLDLLAIEMRS